MQPCASIFHDRFSQGSRLGSAVNGSRYCPSSAVGDLSIDHIATLLEINSLLDRDVHGLSRGQGQRVVIARALLSGPRLSLLDEPLTGLDAKLKDVILLQLEALHDEFGIPMLYVTHDSAEAIRLCDEVITLELGKVLARGKPAEVLST